MTAPGLAATITGVAAFAVVAYAHWDTLQSYEYPADVSATTTARIWYSIHHRGLGSRNLLLLIAAPVIVGVLAYIFTVGLLEVLG